MYINTIYANVIVITNANILQKKKYILQHYGLFILFAVQIQLFSR